MIFFSLGKIGKTVVGCNNSPAELIVVTSFIQTLEKIFVQISSTNICDLVMTIVIMVIVFIVKELNDKYKAKLPVPIPIEVIMVREAFKYNTLNLQTTAHILKL